MAQFTLGRLRPVFRQQLRFDPNAPVSDLLGVRLRGAQPHAALHPAKRAGLLRGDHLRFEIDAQRLRDAGAVCGIGLGAIGDMTLLNVLRGAADLASRIGE